MDILLYKYKYKSTQCNIWVKLVCCIIVYTVFVFSHNHTILLQYFLCNKCSSKGFTLSKETGFLMLLIRMNEE